MIKHRNQEEEKLIGEHKNVFNKRNKGKNNKKESGKNERKENLTYHCVNQLITPYVLRHVQCQRVRKRKKRYLQIPKKTLKYRMRKKVHVLQNTVAV